MISHRLCNAVRFFLGLSAAKPKKHFKANKIALWLNLIPDLMYEGHATDFDNFVEQYGTYQDVFWNIPKLKQVFHDVLNPEIGLVLHTNKTLIFKNELDENIVVSEKVFFAQYSTSFAVTISIGCSLLILNLLIFAVVYQRREKSKVKLTLK